jgi:hypothetical protein
MTCQPRLILAYLRNSFIEAIRCALPMCHLQTQQWLEKTGFDDLLRHQRSFKYFWLQNSVCTSNDIFVLVNQSLNKKRKFCMKKNFDELKSELQAKLLFWNNIKSKQTKALLILIFFGLIGLKVFTTILTFDWLVSLF